MPVITYHDLTMAKAAATSLGNFCVNQHQSILWHKKLYHTVAPNMIGSTAFGRPWLNGWLPELDQGCAGDHSLGVVAHPNSALFCSCHVSFKTGQSRSWEEGPDRLTTQSISKPTGWVLPASVAPTSQIPLAHRQRYRRVLVGRAPSPCLLPDRLGRSHRGRDSHGSAWMAFRLPRKSSGCPILTTSAACYRQGWPRHRRCDLLDEAMPPS